MEGSRPASKKSHVRFSEGVVHISLGHSLALVAQNANWVDYRIDAGYTEVLVFKERDRVGFGTTQNPG